MAALSETSGPPLPEKLQTSWELFLEVVEKYPDEVALVCVQQPSDVYGVRSTPLKFGDLEDEAWKKSPYLRLTYKELHLAVSRLAAGFKDARVKPGTPIFTFLQNGIEFVLTAWATTEMGCVLVPLNPRNLASKDETGHMIKTALSATPDKTPVVIAEEQSVAAVEELGALSPESLKIVVASQQGATTPKNWSPFSQIMATPDHLTVASKTREKGAASSPDAVTDGSILFTSGSTSLPKGVFKRYPMLTNAIIALRRADDFRGVPGTRYCSVGPNNHAMGYITLVYLHVNGGAIIFPGPAFDVDAMLDIMDRERVTDVVLVPTMVHALVGAKAAHDRGPDTKTLRNLVSVTLGGAMVSPALLEKCTGDLGAQSVRVGFGMTEGVVTTISAPGHDLGRMTDGEDVCVGSVGPGLELRVADPETNEVVPRKVLGEIHACSGAILDSYIGGVGSDSFYRDDKGRLWFKTGDQARMDERGRIFITGRYKEMIIRGGENISPSAIEAAICKNPQLAPLQPQIVGVKDIIAGEVPVAVMMGEVDAQIRKQTQQTVLEHMGTLYVPDEVISAPHDLGLHDYPKTMAGKIKRTEIARLVADYLARRDGVDTEGSADDSTPRLDVDMVKNIWAESAGLDIADLPLDAPIGQFADSIMIMRVRDKIRKQMGIAPSIADMLSGGTIAKHIELLQQQKPTIAKSPATINHQFRNGPPGVQDIIHLSLRPDLFEPTKAVVLDAISPNGLEWIDVEDIVPAYDWTSLMVEKGIMASWTLYFGVLTKESDKKTLRKAVASVLENNRILTSFLIQDEKALESKDALHIIPRQNSKLLDLVIHDGGSLQTVAELQKITANYPSQAETHFPGPLTRVILYDIAETRTSAALFNINHAVADASMALTFGEDLKEALSSGGNKKLDRHTDYKVWADSYYNMRTSLAARVAAEWHVRRLMGLENHRQALYPVLGEMISEVENKAKWQNDDSVQHAFDAPAILELRRAHPHITAAIVVKTALALFNVHCTGHTHALFANLEAARSSFPFFSKDLEHIMEASNVSGPTIQAIVNLVEIKRDETALSLLGRMQAEQLELTKHASAPIRQVISGLGPAGGDLIPRVLRAQHFNWVPGMSGSTDEGKGKLRMICRPDQGISLNSGMRGGTVLFELRGTAFDRKGYADIGVKLERIVLWLADSRNWDKPVGRVLDDIA